MTGAFEIRRLTTLIVIALSVIAPCCYAGPPVSSPAVEHVDVFPSAITLKSRRDCRQLLVTGRLHGESSDLTHGAMYASSRPGIAYVQDGVVRAVHDGDATITVRTSGRTVAVPVHVTNSSAPDPVRFKFETLAVLTKQGCSTGSCHGAPHGKGGFVLSLFGYSPAADRISLTRDGFNRRVNVMDPSDSLMIKKPMLQLTHVGGKRLHRTDEAYHVLYDWISEGAPLDLPAVDCTGITVYPSGEQTLRPGADSQQVAVLATYSDGTVRDVTRIAAYSTSSAEVATVTPNGLVTAHGRGQAAVSVRYLDKLVSVHFTKVEPVAGFAWHEPGETTQIDTLVDAKLKQLEYQPAAVCSDSVFVRRLSLDLTGLLPTADQTRAFLANTSHQKRSRLIDALLGTEQYARFWAMKRADLMRDTPGRLEGDRATKFSDWIVESVRTDMPYDQFARQVITSSGDTEQSPAACYFVAIPTKEERTEMTAEIFMGSRLECARCHNHPFENWTMRDYYSIAAVFARTQVDKAKVSLASSGEAVNPSTGETMAPYGMTRTAAATDSIDRRTAFADWLVKPANPFFARVAVNRIWAALMGRGIVEPVDDFRSSNPPSNGPLLDALAADFIKHGYDCKAMIRLICSSRAYQRSSQTVPFNAGDETLFSHAKVRLLTAEQVKDAIGTTTHALGPVESARDKYATQAAYPEHSAFTVTFGLPERATACTCERQTAPTLLQALELLNGPTAHSMAELAPAYYAAYDDGRLVDELYVTGLSRLPSEHEKQIALQFLKRSPDRKSAITDLTWTVINLREFLFQH